MIIHILKLIRSRMGGSGWILAELLVVFVVIWFMTSYFLMMGKSWYEPVGYDLEGVYHAVLAVRPSNTWRPWRSPSLPCPIPFLGREAG